MFPHLTTNVINNSARLSSALVNCGPYRSVGYYDVTDSELQSLQEVVSPSSLKTPDHRGAVKCCIELSCCALAALTLHARDSHSSSSFYLLLVLLLLLLRLLLAPLPLPYDLTFHFCFSETMLSRYAARASLLGNSNHQVNFEFSITAIVLFPSY